MIPEYTEDFDAELFDVYRNSDGTGYLVPLPTFRGVMMRRVADHLAFIFGLDKVTILEQLEWQALVSDAEGCIAWAERTGDVTVMTGMDARPEGFSTLEPMIGTTYKDNALGGDILIEGALEAAQVALKRWHRMKQKIGAMQKRRNVGTTAIANATNDADAFRIYSTLMRLA